MAADSSLMNAPSVMFDTNWKQMSLITKKKEKKKQQTKSFQNSLGGRSLFLFLFYWISKGTTNTESSPLVYGWFASPIYDRPDAM